MSEEMPAEKSSASFFFRDRFKCGTALRAGGTAKGISAQRAAIRTAARLADGGHAIALAAAVMQRTTLCTRTNEHAV